MGIEQQQHGIAHNVLTALVHLSDEITVQSHSKATAYPVSRPLRHP